MPESDKWIPIWKRLQKHHPIQFAMIQEIAKKFQEIRKNVSTKYDLGTEEKRDIVFTVRKAEDNTPALFLNEEGVILLAAMTEVIFDYFGKIFFSDSFTKILEEKSTEAAKKYIEQIMPNIQEQSFRRCPKCHLDNDENAKYCKNCATKLT